MILQEAPKDPGDRSVIEGKLLHHWMLDNETAHELAFGSSSTDHIDQTLLEVESQWDAIVARDEFRHQITEIQHGRLDKELHVFGPCSVDASTNFDKLFDHIQEMQKDNPGVLIAVRLNGSKPRTSGDNTGLFNSVDNEERDALVRAYQNAFARKIPIMTELVSTDEFGRLAPYLSGAWLGARDMGSTKLRTVASATRLPIFIKNGMDGTAKTVAGAIKAVGRGTKENKNSGVNLGFLSHTYTHNGWPAPLPVDKGNNNIGIIARGYELPEDMDPEKKRKLTISHLGGLCTLAAETGRKVWIDGGHGVPPMLNIDRKKESRFPLVMNMLLDAAENGEIDHFAVVMGTICELGTWHGNTDKNLRTSKRNIGKLKSIVTRLGVVKRQLQESAQPVAIDKVKAQL